MSRKKIVNEKERGNNKGGKTMNKEQLEKKLSELEIERRQTSRELSKLESDYCVSLTSRYTDTSNWQADDQHIYNELNKLYRELVVKTDRYKKQLKKLEA